MLNNKDKKSFHINVERKVNTLKNKNQNKKDKLPFAVFICPKIIKEEIEDYKKVFTEIISDRIKQKYK